ncbi:MAG TPA: glutamate--tRNA ligase [Clostridia bacterium]|nr:glutamate--tRNA ligase [Clostridia bacterium]
MAKVRVRFAPSPTGYLHVGGARTVLFNWLFARNQGGDLVLRLEDTDTDRTVVDAAERIMESLRWLGIDWDEGPDVGGPYGPYRQSERREFYREHSKRLLEEGLAYECYCTPEELAKERELAKREGRPAGYSGKCRNLTKTERERLKTLGRRPALRLCVPSVGETVVEDLIRGSVSFENAEIGDFIIVKSDGMPAYNFACVVDDVLMKMTHIIRGDEHLSNTPRQIMIYRALGYELPQFAHVPMILAPDRTKLSKRHGAVSVEEFRDAGFLPEAILNYIALLGWSPQDGEEFMTKDEMVKKFSLQRVSSTPAIYDITKLGWMNGCYIRQKPTEELLNLTVPFLKDAGLVDDEFVRDRKTWLSEVIESVRDRVRTLAEVPDATSFFFAGDFVYDEAGVKKYFEKPDVLSILTRGRSSLENLESWDAQSIETTYRKVAADLGIKGGDLIHPTRLALTGRTAGPGLFVIMSLLGKAEVLKRLDRAIGWIQNKGTGRTPLVP